MALTYKQQFIKFMVESGVLKFGTFTLKSGRIAPYFINTGNFAIKYRQIRSFEII